MDEALKREIGQHFVLGFHGYDVSEEVKSLITKYYVGNIILMKRNVRDAEQVRRLIKDLQQLAKEAGHTRPLMIGIDQENGVVSAFSSPSAGTQLYVEFHSRKDVAGVEPWISPGAMAQAAIGDLEVARAIALACGRELKLVGINWTYGPVADVNINPLNPVIGVRSFGDDPQLVSDYATAASQGFVSANVASCAKHFPGHGDTQVDSHLALPVINKSREEIDGGDLPPFRAVIADQIPSIMTAHIALPQVTGSNEPASISRKITTELLRTELKYEGVIVTDCLEMAAIAEGVGIEEGAVRAIAAGADIAMICHTYARQVGAIERVWAAVEEGRISVTELKRSGERIAALKERFGVEETVEDFGRAWAALKEKNGRLSAEAYRKSAVVFKDEQKLLPVEMKKKRITLLTPLRGSINAAVDARPVVGNTGVPQDAEFAKMLEGYGGPVKHIVYGPDDAVMDSGRTDVVIFVTRNALRAAWQWEVLKKTVKSLRGRVPVVAVASCDPYELSLVDRELGQARVAFVATHEFSVEGLVGGMSRVASM